MRLLTRSDFDGLVCAALLEELSIVDEVLYVHPRDLQANLIKVTENDVIANAQTLKAADFGSIIIPANTNVWDWETVLKDPVILPPAQRKLFLIIIKTILVLIKG